MTWDLEDSRAPVRRAAAIAVALALSCVSPAAGADSSDSHGTSATPASGEPGDQNTRAFDIALGRMTTFDYFRPRYEFAGLPIVGGNSDTGVQVGAALTMSRFEHGVQPYAWKMDFVVKESVLSANGTAGLVQQYYLWQWDVPHLLGGATRVLSTLYYQRAIDQGYFGLGNASSPVAPPNSSHFFEYIESEVRAREQARIRLFDSLDLTLAMMFRAESPLAYPSSLLSIDAATRNPDGTLLLRGIEPQGVSYTGIGMLAAGLIYDTRDNEVFPRKGSFHQIGFRAAEGLPLERDVNYGGFGANLVWMFPLFRRSVVLATRLVLDLQAGDVPFYDLYKGGVFQVDPMIGGANAIRGVPSGRYLGRIKAMGNVELRSLPLQLYLFHQRFHLGGDVFFDTGRTWLNYTFHDPLDGSGVGLKYGTGVGFYALWGQAALFRVDVAYSPDQSAVSSFPVAIYVDEGVMF